MRTSAREYTEDGWLFSFIYNRRKDPVADQSEDIIHYLFFGINMRYAYNFDAFRTDETHAGSERTASLALQEWGNRTEAQKRDMAIIYDQILIQDTPVEDLLALDPNDFQFEELDGEMFFRLMREALTSDADPEPTDIDHMQLPSYGILQEPSFTDGYKFQVSFVSCMGYVDEIYIDLLYQEEPKEDGDTSGNPVGYVQLSDLIESGEATSEQQDIFEEIDKTVQLLRGKEDIPEAIKGMNRDKISNVDFDRLYKFLDHLGRYDYQQYILSPQVNQEEIEK